MPLSKKGYFVSAVHKGVVNEERIYRAIQNGMTSDEKTRETAGIAVYPCSEAAEDIRTGVCEDDGQIVLCSIKMPGNYPIALLYTNEKGQFVTMSETNRKLLSEVTASGELDACPYIPTTVVMTAADS